MMAKMKRRELEALVDKLKTERAEERDRWAEACELAQGDAERHFLEVKRLEARLRQMELRLADANELSDAALGSARSLSQQATQHDIVVRELEGERDRARDTAVLLEQALAQAEADLDAVKSVQAPDVVMAADLTIDHIGAVIRAQIDGLFWAEDKLTGFEFRHDIVTTAKLHFETAPEYTVDLSQKVEVVVPAVVDDEWPY